MSARRPVLYFDSMRGLIPVRRASIVIDCERNVHARVARTTGVYRAGEWITFRWTSLVMVSQRARNATYVVPAIDSATFQVVERMFA